VLAITTRNTTAIPATDAPKIQQVETALRHAPEAALPAVKDPPSVSLSAVDIVATTMEAFSLATDWTGNPHVNTTLENLRVTALVN
jgi:hypothetical protein